MTATAIAAAGAAASRGGGGVSPVFSDEFGALSLDTAMDGSANWIWMWHIWNVNHLVGNGDQAFKAWSGYDPAGGSPAETPAEMGIVLHEVSGGTLKLYGRINPNTTGYGMGYLGGMISSELTHWQKYGIWEIRAKLFSSNGHHWAMWLIAKDGIWPPELDIVEVVSDGANANKLFMNAHGAPDLNDLVYFEDTVPVSSLPAYRPMASEAEWQDWHIYRLVWTSTTIEWWIDGLKRMSLPNYIDKECFFLITPEIGGSWPGAPDGGTVWPQVAEIDYVRVYQGTEVPKVPWTETWTGTNGAAWAAAKWNAAQVTSTTVVDIQSNQGRLNPQGAAFARGRISALTGSLADIEVTATFTMSTVGEQYHFIHLRHWRDWVGEDPHFACGLAMFDGNWEFSKYNLGVKTALATNTVTWGTSAWNLRIRLEGSSMRARWWQGSEPGTWNVDLTDSTIGAGVVSLRSLNGNAVTARPILWDNLVVTML